MTSCFIDIAPDGDTLKFVLKAEILKTPIAGMPFPRPPLTSLDKELRLLRFGDASDDLVKQVTARISEWLLGTDLNGQITTAINLSGNGEQIRLIFNVDEDLREVLADVPFELIVLSGGMEPLVLNPRVASMVHLLPKVGTAVTRSSGWPLKILIVRSNPADLGGAMPPAAPIRQRIQDILEQEALDPGLIHIDILSSEQADNLAGRPTPEELEDQLPKVEYDILIYVGHGDVASNVSPGKNKIGGVLQLEDKKGERHRVLEASTLANWLGEPNPVPVVLLLGCLTADEDIPAEMRDDVRDLLPQWLRGSQGVAQVLLNSTSGVQFAVGMRYKIDTKDAIDFLDFFFRNLLKTKPGNVEAAVRSARRKLQDRTYMWSAPVIFSMLSDEPMFQFMEDPPGCPSVDTSEKVRKSVWRSLAQVKWSAREGDIFKELVPQWHSDLRDSEQEIVDKMNEHKSGLVLPGFGEFKAGNEIRVPVKLIGALKDVEEIEGNITLGTSTFPISQLQATQHLSDSGFSLNSMDNNTGFLIRANGAAASLEAGDLFEMVMKLPSESQGVIPVSISKLKTKPPKRLCPGSNAIVLPLP